MFISYLPLCIMSPSFADTNWILCSTSPSWLLHPYSVSLILYSYLLINFSSLLNLPLSLSDLLLISYISLLLFIDQFFINLPLWHKCQRCSIFNMLDVSFASHVFFLCHHACDCSRISTPVIILCINDLLLLMQGNFSVALDCLG